MTVQTFNMSTKGANNKIALKSFKATIKVQWNEHSFIKCIESLTFT